MLILSINGSKHVNYECTRGHGHRPVHPSHSEGGVKDKWPLIRANHFLPSLYKTKMWITPIWGRELVLGHNGYLSLVIADDMHTFPLSYQSIHSIGLLPIRQVLTGIEKIFFLFWLTFWCHNHDVISRKRDLFDLKGNVVCKMTI